MSESSLSGQKRPRCGENTVPATAMAPPMTTTNQGCPIPFSDASDSLKGEHSRGPVLLQDQILREKLTHFDHERIPERVVHARGAGAHGYFESYADHSDLTSAQFLSQPRLRTPVFVRFSTVQGSRGSSDTVRDIRGFATKFYTTQGNWDLVGNNAPVFFIQDAIKFPDFVHALKGNPQNDIPTGSSAHDSFWDFVSLSPESTHAVFWAMSDRGIPKSFAHMQGFGVHTFRFINQAGVSVFVKFHWTPVQTGVCSLLWDEALKVAGADPDFHRRSLFENIEAGAYPEFELGVQVFNEDLIRVPASGPDDSVLIDLLDPTKLVPTELVPIRPLGKMVLDKNPDNFFAETEQVAFCTAHRIPGIDFSNDPLLQGRLFSYTDTQITRLGGPNFHEIPINRPKCATVNNFQRDGFHRQVVDKGQANYEPNSLGGPLKHEAPQLDEQMSTTAPAVTPPMVTPMETAPSVLTGEMPAFVKNLLVRAKPRGFQDHYSQPRLFYQSFSIPEKKHLESAFTFELSKVTRPWIVQRAVDKMLAPVDLALAEAVAAQLGIKVTPPTAAVPTLTPQASLSQMSYLPKRPVGRKIGILVRDGSRASQVKDIQTFASKNQITALTLGPKRITYTADDDSEIVTDASEEALPSFMFDAVCIPACQSPVQDSVTRIFIKQAFKHLKPIVILQDPTETLQALGLPADEGILIAPEFSAVSDAFIKALCQHRVWSRQPKAEEIDA
ncbi:catalase [Gregarina niphandrodes]|uniref:Catalase n=1 Tax=Gregarina niphandrodes TaxID=110365 RepID=A0A023B2G0_GRENI|nr:catalase [Gregarina niphandrodes]EZG52600.1 catalase [Gregarina niphandrodes]|eukprot:XP_011131886.1 catalase [Gregarina niphandrodes]